MQNSVIAATAAPVVSPGLRGFITASCSRTDYSSTPSIFCSHATASGLYCTKRLGVDPHCTGDCGRIGRPYPASSDLFHFDNVPDGAIQRKEAGANGERRGLAGDLCFDLQRVAKYPAQKEYCCRRSETPYDAHRAHSLSLADECHLRTAGSCRREHGHSAASACRSRLLPPRQFESRGRFRNG